MQLSESPNIIKKNNFNITTSTIQKKTLASITNIKKLKTKQKKISGEKVSSSQHKSVK